MNAQDRILRAAFASLVALGVAATAQSAFAAKDETDFARPVTVR